MADIERLPCGVEHELRADAAIIRSWVDVANGPINREALADRLDRYANAAAELIAKIEALRTEVERWRALCEMDNWQPIETAPKPDIGANGFGKRLLLAVDCGDGTTPSVRRGYWEGTDWYLDCCSGLATDYGYRVTHWRPLPAPPANNPIHLKKES